MFFSRMAAAGVEVVSDVTSDMVTDTIPYALIPT